MDFSSSVPQTRTASFVPAPHQRQGWFVTKQNVLTTSIAEDSLSPQIETLEGRARHLFSSLNNVILASQYGHGENDEE